jgi:hypothetical protein
MREKTGEVLTGSDAKGRDGAFHVVNTADWVPDVPFSLLTINDFTEVNSFIQADQVVKKLKFPKNLVLKLLYNKSGKPSLKALKNYQK